VRKTKKRAETFSATTIPSPDCGAFAMFSTVIRLIRKKLCTITGTFGTWSTPGQADKRKSRDSPVVAITSARLDSLSKVPGTPRYDVSTFSTLCFRWSFVGKYASPSLRFSAPASALRRSRHHGAHKIGLPSEEHGSRSLVAQQASHPSPRHVAVLSRLCCFWYSQQSTSLPGSCGS
jgi:hypothetical protein